MCLYETYFMFLGTTPKFHFSYVVLNYRFVSYCQLSLSQYCKKVLS